MARTSKKEKVAEDVVASAVTEAIKETEAPKVDEPEATAQSDTKTTEEPKVQKNIEECEVSEDIEKLMRLNPQYEKFYVTKDGFVHPVGSPQYLVANATLYKNKYYNK